MRSISRSMILALAIGPMIPTIALCQPDDMVEFEEWDPGPAVDNQPQQPRRPVFRRRRTWRDSPLVWGVAATALAVALPFGVFRVIRQMRYMSQQSQREKAPWERNG